MTTMDWETYAQESRQDGAAFANEPGNQERVRQVVRRCVGTVLDVGGADGYPAGQIAAGGHDVVMLDISDTRVARAREQGLDAHVGDACSLPFDDGSFDTVVLGEILEHLDNPGAALAEAARVARERVIVTVPLNGWADPTHRWRISLDHVQDPERTMGNRTRGHQIVLTWQRGACWPPDYHEHDTTWADQFGTPTSMLDWRWDVDAWVRLVDAKQAQITRLAGENYDLRRELAAVQKQLADRP